MKQVFLSGKGEIAVFDVPVPGRQAGSLLVRNSWSVISAGTEGAAVTRRGGTLGMIEKAAGQRDKIEKVWRMVQTQGLKNTFNLVRGRLEDYTALGYSCAGQVIEVDGADDEFKPGDWVACMGAGYANHAEYVTVPRNLAVKIDNGSSANHAAFGAIACIAQQGIRVAASSPGESMLVIGLGLIGTLCVQQAKSMGYEVFATDLMPQRVEFIRERFGITAWTLGEVDVLREIERATGGFGADAAIICAAAKSSAPLDLACDAVRRKGRLSIVGDVLLHLDRAKIYKKELTVQISTSYGPGRYDQAYEEGGNDYPLSYVRWTEKRNLQFFLKLLQGKALELEPLISARFGVDQAVDAYAFLKNTPNVYGVLIDYGVDAAAPIPETVPPRMVVSGPVPKRTPGMTTLGLIGAGGFAKNVHLPNLVSLADRFKLRAVATRSGSSAGIVGKKFGIPIVTSDYREVLNDPEIDAVLISTRHASHGRFVLEALEAGKHVFVEKPMCIDLNEGIRIKALAAERGLVVRVGFNRRFAPLLRRMRDKVGRQGQRLLTCRVNLGKMESHWSNADDEGGRFMGEGVHFVDFCNWFMDNEPLSVSGRFAGEPSATNPNLIMTMNYAGGSVASVIYSTLGNAGMGKERFEAFGNGISVSVEDYKGLQLNGRMVRPHSGDRHDKGQRQELAEFHLAISGGNDGGAGAEAGLAATRCVLLALADARRDAANPNSIV